MAKDLLKQWEELSLMEVEDGELNIQKDELEGFVSCGRACVLGKLIVDHMVSKETLHSTLMWWWKPLGNLSFKILG